MGEIATLTDRQARLVAALQAGSPLPEAGKAAGYLDWAGTANAMRSRPVQQALRDGREMRLAGDLSEKALKAIDALLEPGVAPAVRGRIAVWTLEALGHGPKQAKAATADVPIHEMTDAQLRQFMARAEATIAEGGQPPLIAIKPGDGALPGGLTVESDEETSA